MQSATLDRPILEQRPQQKETGKRRLGFLDWMRGIAAVTMLQGHVVHSFAGKDWRDGSLFQWSQFVGGLPPAMFLFLTGITMAFLMDSTERQRLDFGARWKIALRRAGYLLLLAFLFRLQLCLFGLPYTAWTDMLKVDILNCMGVGLALLSGLTAFTTEQRARLGALLGLAIAAASPMISGLQWNDDSLLRTYVTPDYNTFSIFPWAAFLAFGISMGSVLRLTKNANYEKLMEVLALIGFALILGAHASSNLLGSVYNQSEFWLNSPALVLIKLGVMLFLMAFAFVWNNKVLPENGWNWLRQLGTTSLLVYWVHIELVYGRWLSAWKENLTAPQTLIAAVAVIVLMLVLSVAQTERSRIRDWFSGLGSLGETQPDESAL